MSDELLSPARPDAMGPEGQVLMKEEKVWDAGQPVEGRCLSAERHQLIRWRTGQAGRRREGPERANFLYNTQQLTLPSYLSIA